MNPTLVRRYMARYGALTASTRRQVIAAWDRTGGITDADLARFIDAASVIVATGQTEVADLVTAYIGTMVGRDLTAPASAAVTDLRSGAAFADVYSRPVVQARTALSKGATFDQALQVARQRAEQLVDTDMAMAHREAARLAMAQDPRIVGYRRVLTGQSCPLCAVASTQRYRTGQLMPIHTHCDCGVAPIVGTRDPGRVINQDLLGELKANAEPGKPYWKDRGLAVDADGTVRRLDADGQPAEALQVAERTHGETGPWLTDATHEFTQL